MQRLLLIVLALILPLQFAWAGAAAYCRHEVAAAAKAHLGHHEHQHQQKGEAGQPATKADADVDKLGIADPDCGVCHVASVPFARADGPRVQASQRVELAQAPRQAGFSSHSARAPDRPQWPRLA
ncbi:MULTISPECIES: cation efflux protein, CzcI family [Cupriavidus]|uniref:Cobalt-zinc-cadmium resistance protein n=1 Tax=Cupriavidus oxalaticus TaxID=96344 RepID=A0A4V1BY56_9BURK|nr:MULTISPECIES: cation efflux protein, CzcI family [Cupriavidus]MBF6990397.1 cobalt-zinc-cadmium resistance protein [Cupriavidus sp. IK-TO18]QBY50652.1 cobalt-zinc-cadmium resistance protein [Cupriavidus oxalaticus]TDF64385.1 cobalt-zinc-cadmium resistance protein [Cupriavidus sp. L7L]